MERFVIAMPIGTSAYLLPCDDGDTCKLETLQNLVGGPIEVVDSCLAGNWSREGDVEAVKLVVNEEGKLRDLPENENAATLYAYDLMDTLVGPAALVAVRGEDLIGFAKPVCETICSEWGLDLAETGEDARFQTFSPD